MKPKAGSLRQSIKLINLLSGWSGKKKEDTLLNMKNDITRDSKDSKRMTKEYYEQLCVNKFDNLIEMEKLEGKIYPNSLKT